ncbi:MAG: hypothetical protein WBN26_02910, partial [Muriicola sp.]
MNRFIKSTDILIIILGTLFSIGSLNGQNTQIDSLKQLVKAGQQDTAMVNTLNNLSIAILQNEDISESLLYSRKANELARKLKYDRGIAYAEKNMGLAEYYQGNN